MSLFPQLVQFCIREKGQGIYGNKVGVQLAKELCTVDRIMVASLASKSVSSSPLSVPILRPLIPMARSFFNCHTSLT